MAAENLQTDENYRPAAGGVTDDANLETRNLRVDPTTNRLKTQSLSTASGDVASDAADSGNPVKIGGIARTSQLAAVANNDRVHAVFNEYGELVIAGYTWGTTSNRFEEIDPISSHHVESTIANASAQGDGTTYYYVDMDSYRSLGLQIENTAGAAGTNTYTVEATIQDDGTAAASCTYQDVTQFGFTNVIAADAASYTADVTLMSKNDLKAVKYLRVKVVRSADGGGTDGAWVIYAKKLY